MAESSYTITWEKKPLGFSIVMNTDGKNAYVSSIQKTENIEKGLKLAAQIIQINNKKVDGLEHQEILKAIRNAECPMKLTFQPRSFANEPDAQKETLKKQAQIPRILKFQGAPDQIKHRVNGYFELTTQVVNDHNVWQRKDTEEDPILVWFYPMKQNGNVKKLWMISRKSQLNTQNAYACCEEDVKYPTQITSTWNIWNQANAKFDTTQIKIVQVKV